MRVSETLAETFVLGKAFAHLDETSSKLRKFAMIPFILPNNFTSSGLTGTGTVKDLEFCAYVYKLVLLFCRPLSVRCSFERTFSMESVFPLLSKSGAALSRPDKAFTVPNLS